MATIKAGNWQSDSIRAHIGGMDLRLLSREEEIVLAQKVQAGLEIQRSRSALALKGHELPELTREEKRTIFMMERSRRAFVEHNMRLVAKIAYQVYVSMDVGKHDGEAMSLQDLIQEGSLGAAKAAEKFDYTKGYKFSTYAYFWIRQAIGRAVSNENRTIRTPMHLLEKRRKISKVRRELRLQLQRTPTELETVCAAEMTMEQYRYAMETTRPLTSLDRTCGEDESMTLMDLIAAEENNSEDDFRFQAAEQILTEARIVGQELLILQMRYGVNTPDGKEQTYRAIGEHFGQDTSWARARLTRIRARIERAKERLERKAAFLHKSAIAS